MSNFATLATLLFCASVQGSFLLSDTCKAALQHLKKNIAASILAVPDSDKLLRLETDAPGNIIAATHCTKDSW